MDNKEVKEKIYEIEELRKKLTSLTGELSDLNVDLVEKKEELDNFQVCYTDSEVVESYERDMDSEPCVIGGVTFAHSYALKTLDPTSYHLGLEEFASNQYDVKKSSGYKSIIDDIEALNDEINNLEVDIEYKESEIKDEKAELKELKINLLSMG